MNRKDFIKQSLTIGASALLVSSLEGCSLFDEAEMLLCQADELLEDQPLEFIFNRKKVLLRREADQIVIFSLVCTHKRCTVAFEQEEEIFVCPCHEGTYDKEGRVIDGPPPAPLKRYSYELREGNIWILNDFVS